MYGELCKSPCPKNCKDKISEKDNGSCSYGCKEHYDGTHCDLCIRGVHGQNCDQNALTEYVNKIQVNVINVSDITMDRNVNFASLGTMVKTAWTYALDDVITKRVTEIIAFVYMVVKKGIQETGVVQKIRTAGNALQIQIVLHVRRAFSANFAI